MKWFLVALAVLACAAAAGTWWFVRAEKQRVATLAAGLITGCPAAQIQVLSLEQGDTTETYALEACGKAVRILCLAPDLKCFVAP